MTIPTDSDTRRLSYPLYRSFEEVPFETSDDNPTFLDLSEWPTTDSTERVRLIFDWSLDEFVAMATAIDVGRDIAYNEKQGIIWWTWIRGLVSMTICDDVADCIDNSEAVAQALANALINNATVNAALQQAWRDASLQNSYNDNPLPDSVLNENLLPLDALCTDQNRYAMALEAVRAMDTLATDFLEIIEVLTNPSEIASQIAGSIPVFGDGLALTLDTANWLQDNIAENYAAAYNPTTEEKIACEIYCIMDGDCTLSFNDALQAYYNAGTISPPTNSDFASTMQWLIANVIPSLDEVVVAAMHTFVLYVAKWSNNWLGINVFNYVKQEMYNAKDEQVTVPATCSCGSQQTWSWSYAANACDYGLPSGWSLTIQEGQCGNGPGAFDGLYDYAGSNDALLQVTLTPPSGTTINSLSFQAGANTTGGTRTMTVNMQTEIYNGGLSSGFTSYNFTPDEQGAIVWVLQQTASGFNGVLIRQIAVDYTS